MSGPEENAKVLRDKILAGPRMGKRRLVAVAGAPASGKSLLADHLATQLCDAGCLSQVVPMDGFHLHNQFLVERGLLNRKGAPETFDVAGFLHLVARLHDEPAVYYPTFDRGRDIAIAGSGLIKEHCDTVIIEGNYLLFDELNWRDLRAHWDVAIWLDVPMPTLRTRLVERWLAHGLSLEQAQARASENDLANAELISRAQLPADLVA